MKKIKALFLNILHDKFLVFLLSLSFGLFIGSMTFNSNIFQASIIQIPNTSLNGSEVAAFFPDIQNIKDCFLHVGCIDTHRTTADFAAV